MLRSCMLLQKPLCRWRHGAALPAFTTVSVRSFKDSQRARHTRQSAARDLPQRCTAPRAVPQQRAFIRSTACAAAEAQHEGSETKTEPQRQPQRVTVYFGGDGVTGGIYTTAEPGENLWAVRIAPTTLSYRCHHCSIRLAFNAPTVQLKMPCIVHVGRQQVRSDRPHIMQLWLLRHMRGGLLEQRCGAATTPCLCWHSGNVIIHHLRLADGGAQVGCGGSRRRHIHCSDVHRR